MDNNLYSLKNIIYCSREKPPIQSFLWKANKILIQAVKNGLMYRALFRLKMDVW